MKCNLKTTGNDNYEFDPQYLRMKKENRILKNQLKTSMTFIKVVCCMAFFFAVVIMATSKKMESMEGEITRLKNTNAILVAKDEDLTNSYNKMSETLKTTSEAAVELDNSLTELKKDNIDLQNRIKGYEEREELFDKYEYAIIRKDGTRTDITYDNIKNLEDLCSEKGMNQEAVNLVLALAMTESDGTEKVDNNSSTARGYGQILSSTGQFVYCRLMNNSNYTHQLAYDGETNFAMMVNYLDWLNDKHKGNLNGIINEYRGLKSTDYIVKVDKYLSKSNLSLNTLKIK